LHQPHHHSRAFLSAAWRDLVMLNYEVPEGVLRPLVPRGVELDRWNNHLYVSVVGFRFLHTRLLGVAIPGHGSFEEVNLRFYVRRRIGDEMRRGVVFVRELVPKRAVALLARFAYNEPYRALAMRHRIEVDGDQQTRREYAWRTNREWTRLQAVTEGSAQPLVGGSEEEFITEHHWGYTRQRDGGTIEYRVEHPRWNVWNASAASLTGDLASTYGPEFSRAMAGPPRSAFVADGSPVTVYAPTNIGRR
jgi:uncharacterized protein YqjF (DUF2071 family)